MSFGERLSTRIFASYLRSQVRQSAARPQAATQIDLRDTQHEKSVGYGGYYRYCRPVVEYSQTGVME